MVPAFTSKIGLLAFPTTLFKDDSLTPMSGKLDWLGRPIGYIPCTAHSYILHANSVSSKTSDHHGIKGLYPSPGLILGLFTRSFIYTTNPSPNVLPARDGSPQPSEIPASLVSHEL